MIRFPYYPLTPRVDETTRFLLADRGFEVLPNPGIPEAMNAAFGLEVAGSNDPRPGENCSCALGFPREKCDYVSASYEIVTPTGEVVPAHANGPFLPDARRVKFSFRQITYRGYVRVEVEIDRFSGRSADGYRVSDMVLSRIESRLFGESRRRASR